MVCFLRMPLPNRMQLVRFWQFDVKHIWKGMYHDCQHVTQAKGQAKGTKLDGKA
jgi:hypothetical protein